MKDFNKIWSKAQNEIMEGNENYQFYSLSNEKRTFAIGRKGVEPHTLLICWEIESKVIIEGYYNEEKIELEDKKDKEEEFIRIILNRDSNKNIKIISATNNNEYIYSKKSNYEDKIHKIIVFQDNDHLTDILLYDSETNMSPSYIVSKDEEMRKHLKNIALSMLCKYDRKLYKLFSDIECRSGIISKENSN